MTDDRKQTLFAANVANTAVALVAILEAADIYYSGGTRNHL